MENILNQLAVSVPNLIGALVILVVGIIVAYIVRGLVAAALRRTGLGVRIGRALGAQDAAQVRRYDDYVARGVFYLILLFVLLAFFQSLNLTIIAGPLNTFLDQVLGYLPGLIGAIILAIIAYIVARVLRAIVVRVSAGAGLDTRFNQTTGPDAPNVQVSRTLGELVYYLVWLLFLPAILNALGLQGLLAPVQTLLNQVLGYLPNLFAAAVILIAGYFVAKIVQRIVTGLLAAIGTDQFAARLGINRALGGQQLSSLLGLIVYVLIFIPVIIAALNALAIEAITGPASAMLNQILQAIPNIFAAIVLLAIAYVVGRVVAGIVTNLLTGIGFNTLPQRLGLAARRPEATPTPSEAAAAARTTTPLNTDTSASAGAASMSGPTTPAQIVGYIVLGAIMLFATIEALQLLGFDQLATIFTQLTVLIGRVLIGLLVFAIGLWLANLAYRTISSNGTGQSRILAQAARLAILVLAGAMALQQMGIAEDIINLAFGLILGAVAVAAAIAFGLGGRETAAQILARYRPAIQRSLPSPDQTPPPPTTPPTTPPRTPPPTTPPTTPPRTPPTTPPTSR